MRRADEHDTARHKASRDRIASQMPAVTEPRTSSVRFARTIKPTKNKSYRSSDASNAVWFQGGERIILRKAVKADENLADAQKSKGS